MGSKFLLAVVKIPGYGIFSLFLAFIFPIKEMLLIAFLAWIADLWSAFRLSRRVRKYHQRSSGKFRSSKMNKSFGWMLVAMAALIFAYFIDLHLLRSGQDDTAVRYVLGAYLFKQAWSILESESSCNGSPWAVLLQKIMIDKTERHFDVDLSSLEKEVQNAKN
ncbi:MAG: hypothetical protein PHV20_12330 [Bacteroidales bacterium]|nr:hypothetical protein [Bacteroidales bacterium]